MWLSATMLCSLRLLARQIFSLEVCDTLRSTPLVKTMRLT